MSRYGADCGDGCIFAAALATVNEATQACGSANALTCEPRSNDVAEKNAKKQADDKADLSAAEYCPVCKQKKTVYKLVDGGKGRMAFECKCGLFDRQGRKL